MLDIVPGCNLVQYQGNIIMQPCENGKNPNIWPDLGPLKFFSWALAPLVVRQYPKLTSYAVSGKTNEPNLKKWHKI